VGAKQHVATSHATTRASRSSIDRPIDALAQYTSTRALAISIFLERLRDGSGARDMKRSGQSDLGDSCMLNGDNGVPNSSGTCC